MKALILAALLLTQGAGMTQVKTNTVCKSEAIKDIAEMAQTDIQLAVQMTIEGLRVGLCMRFPLQWVPARPVGEMMTDAQGEQMQIYVLTIEDRDTDGYTLGFPRYNVR